MIEGSLLAYQRLHAAHSGGEFRVLNIEVDIGRELTGVAVGTQIVGPRYLDCAHHCENGPGAQLPVLGSVTTRTRPPALISSRGVVLQQFAQGGSTGLMEGAPQCRLHSLQIGSTLFAALRKDSAQKLIHFPRNLLMDCSSRFFSSVVQPTCGC